MALTAPPAKIKAALSTIKETILDNTNAAAGTAEPVVALETCVWALLRVELLLRGTIVAHVDSSSDSDSNLATATLQAMQTHAGKSLVEEPWLPKPLLAASAVVAGRIAERIAHTIMATTTTAATRTNPSNNQDTLLWWDTTESTSSNIGAPEIVSLRRLLQSCRARCHEVGDVRLQSLLAWRTNDKDIQDDQHHRVWWSMVAEGYYLRAASIQPDTPPVWKKAWDCVKERYVQGGVDFDTCNETNASTTITTKPFVHWQATTAVFNLHRIAVGKSNTKRAVELALILTDCYLHGAAAGAVDSRADSTNNAPTKAMEAAFIEPYRPIQPHTLSPTAALAQARATLIELDATTDALVAFLDDNDQLYRRLLRVRLHRAEWETSIEVAAETEYAHLLHRVAADDSRRSTRPSRPPSMAACRTTARIQHWATTDTALSTPYQALSEQLQASAMTLQEGIIMGNSGMVTEAPIARTSIHEDTVWTVLRNHAEWLLERAQVMATTLNDDEESTNYLQGYRDLASFINPLWETLRNRIDMDEETAMTENDSVIGLERAVESALSNEERRCFETICIAIPTIAWLLQESSSSPTRLFDSFLFGVLKIFEKIRVDARQKEMAASNAIGTYVSRDNARVEALGRCLAYVSAFRALERSPDDRDAQFQISRQAVTTRSTAPTASADSLEQCGQVGSSFLEFLVCWSGFHQTPWSFCTQPEARRIVEKARLEIELSRSQWGRRISTIEQAMLELGEADAEGFAFEVGLAHVARTKYRSVMVLADSFSNEVLKDVMISHCYTGLAELEMREGIGSLSGKETVESSFVTLARSGLDRLLATQFESIDPRQSLFLWRSSDFIEFTLRFRIATARQLVADAMLRSGDVPAAQRFLEDAVRDAPIDANAAFALGSFRLYLLFFGSDQSPEIEKAAQVQLLRAAKMDSTRAGPFALLGCWYEYKKDYARATGCYSKALLLDPVHPVAGRGLVRLAPPDILDRVLEKAIQNASTVNGWAWLALGLRKSLFEGRDDHSIISFLRALRCRDIERPEGETLATFYANPLSPRLANHDEMSSALAALAACYRRLGRYTAAIRSYRAAIHHAGDEVPASVLCSCAQVELELGLFGDAVKKFAVVVEREDKSLLPLAVHGNCVALLCIAQQAMQDGKAGLAYLHINDGLQIQKRFGDPSSVCGLKLMGDLHSFAASLPLRAFGEDSQFNRHVDFVSEGAAFYKSAELLVTGTSEESVTLRASLLTDFGSNLLLQAQLWSNWDGKGLGRLPSKNSSALLNDAASHFQRALEVSPTYPQAWCGLGCSLVHSDPLLAQHAFARAIELDKLSPDAYANLSFLYTANQRYEASIAVSDALTEVADTPMMWINRALIFEQNAADESDKVRSRHVAIQAVDAYRASLQVMQHPTALLGLSLTCRVSYHADTTRSEKSKESYSWASVYADNFGSHDIPSILIEKALQMEVGNMVCINESGEDMVREGRQGMQKGLCAIEEYSSKNDAIDIPLVGAFRELMASADCDPPSVDNGQHGKDCCSLHRLVVHFPNQGDLWIRFAKQLTSGAELDDATKTLRPALVAVRRATTILQQQLTQVQRLHATLKDRANTVQADDLSDALALQYCLESIVFSTIDSGEVVDTTGYCDVVALQRSLLISPGNSMARQALLQCNS